MGRKRKGRDAENKLVDQLNQFQGPTPQRLNHATQAGTKCYLETGQARANRRYTMMDDNLGRLVLRKQLTETQFSALQRYAIHWYLGGLAGSLGSFDMDRIRAANPAALGGLARSESELHHRKIYQSARAEIGGWRAYIADMVACNDYPLAAAGIVLGYASPYRGRARAGEMLQDAGSRLEHFWNKFDKRAR
jgi:hypothetical protein